MRNIALLLASALLAVCSFGPMGIAQKPKTVGEAFARAAEIIGQPPKDFTTAFFVIEEAPQEHLGGECSITVITPHISYDLIPVSTFDCKHLPSYHTMVWGKVAHRLLGNVVELVTCSHCDTKRIPHVTYDVQDATAIDVSDEKIQ